MHMLADPTAIKLEPHQLARIARMTARGASAGTLVYDDKPAPMATTVGTACCHDGAPLVQCSRANAPETATLVVCNEIAGLNVGIQGRLVPADGHGIDRFFRRHTEPEAGDASLAVYRLTPEAVYVETGDREVRWLDDTYLLPIEAGDLAEAEAGIVEHVNGGHPDTIHAIMAHRGFGADDWVMTGADPEGIDVARGHHVFRIAFDKPVHSREAFKRTMVALRVAGGGQAVPPQQAAAAE